MRLKRTYNHDLLFLIETKTNRVCMEDIKVKLGFSSKLVVKSIGRSGGLCLMWSGSADVSLLSFS